MSLMVDISGLDNRECHIQCQWQRVTEYLYFLSYLKYAQNLQESNLHECRAVKLYRYDITNDVTDDVTDNVTDYVTDGVSHGADGSGADTGEAAQKTRIFY